MAKIRYSCASRRDHREIRTSGRFRHLGTKFIHETDSDHKLATTDRILAADPGLPFVLVGDTGRHDPRIYADANERRPDRFLQAHFRMPEGGLDAAHEQWIARIRAAGVEVSVRPVFYQATEAIPVPRRS